MRAVYKEHLKYVEIASRFLGSLAIVYSMPYLTENEIRSFRIANGSEVKKREYVTEFFAPLHISQELWFYQWTWVVQF